MVKRNYHAELGKIISDIQGKRPTLLLHACCAPCSSYVLELLSQVFDITVYYYNPNISPESEYDLRSKELERLAAELPLESKISTRIAPYDPAPFEEMARGKEDMSEGGARCYECYKLRLEETARAAKEGGYDFFCTTLSVSPYKKADWLNKLGEELSKKYGVPYLFSDFKKKNGYKRSCDLSREYGLYRQAFCGCEYSRKEAEKTGRI